MLTKTPKQMLAHLVARPTRASRAIGTSRGVPRARLLLFISIAVTMTFTSLVSAKRFGDWSAPVNAESIPGTSSELNTTANEGYPVLSPDGLSLYLVSDRSVGGFGSLDIWVAHRASTNDAWGAPENLGLPVNSNANDWGPAPVPGHGLFFVSTRADSCGLDDIYFTRFKNGAREEPQNVGCQINSTTFDFGPSYFEDESGNATLYFSSNRAGGFEAGGADQDIYFSVNSGPAQLAPGLNTAFNDVRPYVRKDGREIVFDSNRDGYTGGVRNMDIWTASRETAADDWSTPTNLGSVINTAANEARPTLSRDGLTMFFGSNRLGSELAPSGLPSSDIYVTTREKLTGKNH
jgi:Tol biopolymer transport system component